MRERFETAFKDEIEKIMKIFENAGINLDRKAAEIIFKVEFIVYLALKVNQEKNIFKTIEHIRKSEFSPSFKLYEELSEKSRHYIALISMISQWNVRDIMVKDILAYEKEEHLHINRELLKLDEIESIKIDKQLWEDELGRLSRNLIYEEASDKILDNKRNLNMDLTKLKNKKYFVKHNGKEIFFNKEIFEGIDNNFGKIGVNYVERQEIGFSIAELTSAAKMMDQVLGKCINGDNVEKDWESRIQQLEFFLYDNSEKLADYISIKETQNWVGLLNVGKTTLMKVIAYMNSLKGIKTTLVLKDNIEVYKTVELFYKLGKKAVPITSDNNRMKIFKDITSEKQKNPEDILSIFDDKSYEYVSQNCPLKEYLLTNESDEKLYSNEELVNICSNIYCSYTNKRRKEEEKRIGCPIVNKCNYYKSKNELPEADIYVTTINAIIYGNTKEELFNENMSYLEYVYKTSQLIMVDESDSGQYTLDSIFIPSEDLFNGSNSTIEYLYSILPGKFKGNRGRISSELHDWERNLLSLDSLVISIFSSLVHTEDFFTELIKNKTGHPFDENLREYKGIINASKKGIFNSRKLFSMLAMFMTTDTDNDEFKNEQGDQQRLMLEYFLKECEEYSFDSDNDFSRAVQAAPYDKRYFNYITGSYWEELKKKYKVVERLNEDNYFEKSLLNILRIAITVFAFENAYIRVLSEHYNVKNELLALKIDNEEIARSLMLFNRLREYDSILPIAPLGSEIGLTIDGDDGKETLKLYKYLFIGRYLFINFDKLFKYIDMKEGPKVVLLSGTSFSPKSSKYNLELDVPYIIKRKGNHNIKLEYEAMPLFAEDGKLIVVSGKRDKGVFKAIDAMGKALTKRIGINNCILENKLFELEEHRRRIMIIVGSYDECKCLKESLVKHYKGDVLKFAALNDDIKRSDITNFSSKEFNVLIAPLLAVHRGHNILTKKNNNLNTDEELNAEEVLEKSEAAFGAIAYGKRPYPKPHTLSELAAILNENANSELHNSREDDVKTVVDTIFRRARALYKNFYSKTFYKDLEPEQRLQLIANIGVDTNQLEGRLIRGDVDAKVYFLDGAFFPNLDKGMKEDITSSMLIGLREYYINTPKELDEKGRYIFNELYGYRIEAFKNMKGLNLDD